MSYSFTINPNGYTLYPDGSYEYRVNGKLHREDEAACMNAKGSKFWYQHGVLHRIGGPAIETIVGSQFWYQHGVLHREDGPAFFSKEVIGCRTAIAEWYLNGEKMLCDSQQEFERLLRLKAFW